VGTFGTYGAEIRALHPGDDLDAQIDLAERAFGIRPPAVRESWRRELSVLIAAGRCFGAFAGGRPAGAARFHDMRQWWHGRAVPMAGIGGVAVAPEDRGRGIGRQLVTSVLAEVAARGYPLSVLYPATMPLYRSLGWELAGARYSAVIPGRSLRSLASPDAAVAPPGARVVSAETLASAGGSPGGAGPAFRRAGPGDAEAVNSVIGRVHEAARDCGPITWDADAVRRSLADQGTYHYICDDGYLAYHWRNENDEIFVQRAYGLSPATVRALWALVASHTSVAGTVRACVGPADPFWWLTREPDAGLSVSYMWMFRVVDAPAAIAARGFPPLGHAGAGGPIPHPPLAAACPRSPSSV